MSVQTIQGLGGAVAMPTGFVAKIGKWTAKFNVEDVDTTGFVDVGYHTHEVVAIGLTGSATGIGEYDSTSSSAATPSPSTGLGATPTLNSWKGTITLTAQTGCTYAFTAVISMNQDRAWNGALMVTYDFKSSGAITQTWASL